MICNVDSRTGLELIFSLLSLLSPVPAAAAGGGHSLTIVIIKINNLSMDLSICKFRWDVAVPLSKLLRLCTDNSPRAPMNSSSFHIDAEVELTALNLSRAATAFSLNVTVETSAASLALSYNTEGRLVTSPPPPAAAASSEWPCLLEWWKPRPTASSFAREEECANPDFEVLAEERAES